ncbi:GNAT family N-acetyltransferase [Oxalobacteraceae bacterium]|nr:GNAT family N-acetyltransferase [Oxalobacteraceae bacterium]
MRHADTADAPAVSALIAGLLPFLTIAPDGSGAQQFATTLSAAAIASYIDNSRYDYRLAYADGALAGVVALRDGGHVFHLFVVQALHGRGLGRRMWEAARAAAVAAGHGGGFTVNSSVSAQPMYERLGFQATGPRVEQNGVAYVPMRLA